MRGKTHAGVGDAVSAAGSEVIKLERERAQAGCVAGMRAGAVAAGTPAIAAGDGFRRAAVMLQVNAGMMMHVRH